MHSENPERRSELAGYLYVHFKRETADGEQIHFALSDGNDPLHFDDLNGGKPVLFSTLGEGGVRDPHIVRAPGGDRFYMVATDLRAHDGLGWESYVRHGSRSIMIWESADLIDWGAGRLVEVAPPEAGNAWAPESIWDPVHEAFLVHWSSTLYEDPDHTGTSHQRILRSYTRDFREFSTPEVWVDRGWHTIDATVIPHRGHYHRFLKDERSRDRSVPQGKSVFSEMSASLSADSWDPLSEGIGLDVISQGEGPLIYRANTEEKWFLWIDEFTDERRYVPFETTDLDGGHWTACEQFRLPKDPCHGVVLPVTAEEHERLRGAWGDVSSV
jgi:hypothetical protein